MKIMSQLDPVVNQPLLYVNGLAISNDATTPNTKLDIAAGQCRDSNNIIDMQLGDFLNEGYGTANSSTTLNAAVVGINGLDTGTLGASHVYALYVIGDSSAKNPTGTILSLNQSTPGLPFGYDSYRKIGYWTTDSSSHFLKGAYSASGNGVRTFYYDAPISVGTTSSSASYAAINLTNFVPLVNNIPVWLNVSFSGTANDTMNLQPGNATGNAITITAQVTSQAQTQDVRVLAQNTVISTVNSPTINYKNSGTDTIAILVNGYDIAL
jgi:hypothetical protein